MTATDPIRAVADALRARARGRPAAAALLVVTLCAAAAVATVPTAAAAPTVSAGDASVATGETTTVPVILSEAPDGLAGFNVSVTLADGSTATVVDASVSSTFGLQKSSTTDDRATLVASDTDDAVEAGATDVRLGTLTIRGDADGSTALVVSVAQMDADGGARVDPGTEDGSLTVGGGDGGTTIRDVSLDPDEVGDDRTVTHTLTIDVAGVSDDGNTDTVSVDVPSAVEGVSLGSASVADADGDRVAITGTDVSGTRVTVDVSPDSGAETRDLTATLTFDVTYPDVTEDASEEVAVDVRDSDLGSDSATVPLTIRDGGGTTPGGPTLSIEPADAPVPERGTTTLDVVLRGVDDGVSAYDVDLAVGRTTTASIVSVSNAIGGTEATDVATDGSSASVTTIGAGESGSGPITLATVTVRGNSAGETNLTITASDVSDADNDPYSLADRRGAILRVGADVGLPPVCPGGDRPTDPDDDGVYEDANGDGSFDVFDVQCLLERFGSDAVQDNPSAFDFTADGTVDVFDVQAALDEL